MADAHVHSTASAMSEEDAILAQVDLSFPARPDAPVSHLPPHHSAPVTPYGLQPAPSLPNPKRT
eukprot:5250828-Karenia_brevis.AAC.1